MATRDIEIACLGTTVTGHPCTRNKGRHTYKYTKAAAFMQRQRSPSTPLSIVMPSAQLVGLEFCFQHQRQAELLHALIQQQQVTGPVKDGLRLTPDVGLNVLDLQDPAIRATFFDIPTDTVFLQQDIDSTVARIPEYLATQQKLFPKPKPAIARSETDPSCAEDEPAEATTAQFAFLSTEENLTSGYLSSGATDLAVARRQSSRLSPSLTPGLNYKAATPTPEASTSKAKSATTAQTLMIRSDQSQKEDRAISAALSSLERAAASPSPPAIEAMVDGIVRRALQQTAAMQKAQQEWKACAKVYRQDLDHFRQLLKEQREANRSESETDVTDED